jgi:hypothetical protein
MLPRARVAITLFTTLFTALSATEGTEDTEEKPFAKKAAPQVFFLDIDV